MLVYMMNSTDKKVLKSSKNKDQSQAHFHEAFYKTEIDSARLTKVNPKLD